MLTKHTYMDGWCNQTIVVIVVAVVVVIFSATFLTFCSYFVHFFLCTCVYCMVCIRTVCTVHLLLINQNWTMFISFGYISKCIIFAILIQIFVISFFFSIRVRWSRKRVYFERYRFYHNKMSRNSSRLKIVHSS